MKIHVSEPCKQLLSAQYKLEQRDDAQVRENCGGHVSYFLMSKDGRQPLRPEVIKALLPTDAGNSKIVSYFNTYNQSKVISRYFKQV